MREFSASSGSVPAGGHKAVTFTYALPAGYKIFAVNARTPNNDIIVSLQSCGDTKATVNVRNGGASANMFTIYLTLSLCLA